MIVSVLQQVEAPCWYEHGALWPLPETELTASLQPIVALSPQAPEVSMKNREKDTFSGKLFLILGNFMWVRLFLFGNPFLKIKSLIIIYRSISNYLDRAWISDMGKDPHKKEQKKNVTSEKKNSNVTLNEEHFCILNSFVNNVSLNCKRCFFRRLKNTAGRKKWLQGVRTV